MHVLLHKNQSSSFLLRTFRFPNFRFLKATGASDSVARLVFNCLSLNFFPVTGSAGVVPLSWDVSVGCSSSVLKKKLFRVRVSKYVR